MKTGKISFAAVRRLPKYLREADLLIRQGKYSATSDELGEFLGITPSQIRNDLSRFGYFGHQGRGYNLPALRASIKDLLGANQGLTAILIGAGNMGCALLSNQIPENSGYTIKAIFDVREDLFDKHYNGTPVQHMENLEAFLAANLIDAALLCVPSADAYPVALRLAYGGIGAILNFTGTDLFIPNSQVLVENMHFSDNLQIIGYYLTDRARDAKKREARMRVSRSQPESPNEGYHTHSR